MKKMMALMLVVSILLSVMTVGAATAILYGDANGDGKINNKDIGLLQQYVNGWDVQLGPTGGSGATTTAASPNDTTMSPTYTTAGPSATTTKSTSTSARPTTTATMPTYKTTARPTTTSHATNPIVLPALGTDIDVKNAKDRILVSDIAALRNADGTYSVSLTLTNFSSVWTTEETDWVEYTCYDFHNNILKVEKIEIGCIDTRNGSEKTFTFIVPADTAEVRLTDSKITYWTEWS